MRFFTLAPVAFVLTATLMSQDSTQSVEFRAMHDFSGRQTRFLSIIKMPGHAYFDKLPGFICTIYFDAKLKSRGFIKYAVIKPGTLPNDLIDLASERNSAAHQTTECPEGLLRKLRTFSIPHSLTPSTGLASAGMDADQIFILYKQDQTESFTKHWSAERLHPISLLVSNVESSILGRLTQRSTRTQPLPSTRPQ